MSIATHMGPDPTNLDGFVGSYVFTCDTCIERLWVLSSGMRVGIDGNDEAMMRP